MERFTEKFKDGRNILRKGITDIFHIGFGRFFNGEAIDKLSEYEDLEEQGKLLKLPCSVGDTVYEVQELRKVIQAYIITAVHISDNTENFYSWILKDGKCAYSYSNMCGFSGYSIGQQVFLTREEAEAALKEMEWKK